MEWQYFSGCFGLNHYVAYSNSYESLFWEQICLCLLKTYINPNFLIKKVLRVELQKITVSLPSVLPCVSIWDADVVGCDFWSETLSMCCPCLEEGGLGSWRRIFINSWLLFSECVCPLPLSFSWAESPNAFSVLQREPVQGWFLPALSAILYATH